MRFSTTNWTALNLNKSINNYNRMVITTMVISFNINSICMDTKFSLALRKFKVRVLREILYI